MWQKLRSFRTLPSVPKIPAQAELERGTLDFRYNSFSTYAEWEFVVSAEEVRRHHLQAGQAGTGGGCARTRPVVTEAQIRRSGGP